MRHAKHFAEMTYVVSCDLGLPPMSVLGESLLLQQHLVDPVNSSSGELARSLKELAVTLLIGIVGGGLVTLTEGDEIWFDVLLSLVGEHVWRRMSTPTMSRTWTPFVTFVDTWW